MAGFERKQHRSLPALCKALQDLLRIGDAQHMAQVYRLQGQIFLSRGVPRRQPIDWPAISIQHNRYGGPAALFAYSYLGTLIFSAGMTA